MWAVDVNERALALTQANAAAAGLGNVRAVAPDEVPEDVRFAAIWSNPPVRIGKAALHDLLTAGSAAWPTTVTPCSWCRSTSAPTRCTAGSSSRGGGSPGRASRMAYRVLEVRR